ncbi:hypothetical protein BGZ80_008035 [Entomortierella chlamydospora]|uniref:Pul domain-containing protein n=1 Tax=Entomortierella chlamydospora TaxID=101097 RepID=A0A9P6MY96_9FUNG|nr:hypothetical protein BGZ80_008035 [Entomortierella chlamydospora]
MAEKVTLFVYDLSQGMARNMSLGFIGRQIDAIYHTSVVVFGREFYYGQGIMSAIPGTTMHGQPVERVDMGETEIPQEVFMEFMDNMRETYTADAYHLLDNNCNNFSNDVCQFLVGRTIPSHITSLPADFLNTPFGQAMRPMIESMFGPSRHPSPQPPQPSIAPGAFNSAGSPVPLTGTGSSAASIPYMTDLGQLRSTIQNNTATVVYFTSATCPPCRVIMPIFDELVLAKGQKIKGVKVDVGLSGTPILFHSLDNLDAVFAKLKSFLPAENGLSEAETKQLDKIHAWLKKRADAKTNKTAEPTLGELGATWKPLIGKIQGLLPYENLFPLLDIIRMLILHNRVAEVYAKDGNLTLVNMFKAVVDQGNEGSKPVALMTLRIACNTFSSPLLGTYILSSTARESTKQLLVTTLLSPVDQQRQTAASLAFDIGVKIAESRSKATDTVTPSLSGGPLEDLEEDWNVECLSAIAAAIEKENSEEIIHRLVASVANFIFKEESYAGAVLMNILGLPETLDAKIQSKIVKAPNVTGLCRELQEMIKTAVEEQARSQS